MDSKSRLLCRILGQHLARGTPTPKTWIRRHGDQRVPLTLTIASNHTMYRLPSTLQAIIDTERQAAEDATTAPASPAPVPEPTVAVNNEADVQDSGGDAGNTRVRGLSAGPRDALRAAIRLSMQLSHTSRCTPETSVHSAEPN
jgi:hypothetical protein